MTSEGKVPGQKHAALDCASIFRPTSQMLLSNFERPNVLESWVTVSAERSTERSFHLGYRKRLRGWKEFQLTYSREIGERQRRVKP